MSTDKSMLKGHLWAAFMGVIQGLALSLLAVFIIQMIAIFLGS